MGRRSAADRSARRTSAGWRLLLLCAAIGVAAGAHAGRPSTDVAPASHLPRQQVLWRALRADPSQQYLLYVPRAGGHGAPLLVDTHGFSRNVEEHATLFAPYAERYGVVLVAPYFSRDRHADYQRLGRKDVRRADLALDAIVEEVETLTGAEADKFYLFGFSGGAQFAHRYALAHPERVARAVVAAAGWYTFPDGATRYPYGLALGDELPGVRFEPEAFLRVPIRVIVGEADTGSRNLRRNARVDRQQGTTRRERAHNWTRAMRRAAEARGYEPLVTCEEVARAGHSFERFMREGGLGDKVFEALFGEAPGTRTRRGAESAAAGGVR